MNDHISSQSQLPSLQTAATQPIFMPQEDINARLIHAEHENKRARRGQTWARFLSVILFFMLMTAVGFSAFNYFTTSAQLADKEDDVAAAEALQATAEENLANLTARFEAQREELAARRQLYFGIFGYEDDIKRSTSRLEELTELLKEPPAEPARIQDALNERSDAGALRTSYQDALEAEAEKMKAAVKSVETYIYSRPETIVVPPVRCDPWDDDAVCGN